MNRSTNEWQEQVSFFNVVAWREMAENVANSLTKGSRVVVTGRLEQRSWETENGEKRSVIEIAADEIGPSLRWATASVTRNERRDGDGAGRPAAAPTANEPAATPAAGYDDLGEEPF
jgi:single-strand DNA-binding protein